MTRARRNAPGMPGRRATAARAAALVALTCLLAGPLAACGIPADEGPRAISDEGAPDDLGTDVEVNGGQSATADLYFTRSDGEQDRLIPVERQVPTGGSSSPAPATVFEALLDGPSGTDNVEGLATKLPNATALAGPPDLTGGVLTVDLNQAISGVQGVGAQLAFGQLVCTGDALAGVDGIRFTREGRPQAATIGNGETDTGVLTCDDYGNLLDPTVTLDDAGSPEAAGD